MFATTFFSGNGVIGKLNKIITKPFRKTNLHNKKAFKKEQTPSKLRVALHFIIVTD